MAHIKLYQSLGYSGCALSYVGRKSVDVGAIKVKELYWR